MTSGDWKQKTDSWDISEDWPFLSMILDKAEEKNLKEAGRSPALVSVGTVMLLTMAGNTANPNRVKKCWHHTPLAGMWTRTTTFTDSMKAGQPSNPLPKNTLGRNAWYVSKVHTRMLTAPLFSTANDRETQCLSTGTSVSGSTFTQWKTTHRGEEWTATHSNMGGWALAHQYERGHSVWLHVCETENSATVTEVQWERSALKAKRKGAERMEHFLS